MKIAIRADAAEKIGTGHIMRSLSLALALRERGHQVEFISRAFQGHCLERVRAQGFSVAELPDRKGVIPFAESETQWWKGFDAPLDAQETRIELERFQPDWLIVDHYAINADWLQRLRKVVSRHLVIDDLLNRDLPCDVLLDPGLKPRPKPRRPQDLLGPDYALLRPAFALAHARGPRVVDLPRTALVFLTGGDDQGAMWFLAQAIAATSSALHFQFLVSSATRDADQLSDLARERGWSVLPPASDIIPYLLAADIAIGAAGSSLWERCCLGLPQAVVSLAPNQDVSLPYAEAEGLVHYLGKVRELSREELTQNLMSFLGDSVRLKRLAEVSWARVDGLGAGRVAKALELF